MKRACAGLLALLTWTTAVAASDWKRAALSEMDLLGQQIRALPRTGAEGARELLLTRYELLSGQLGGDDPAHLVRRRAGQRATSLPARETTGAASPYLVNCATTTRTYNSTGPVTVVDNGVVNSTIEVRNAGRQILHVQVLTLLQHAWAEDVDMTLRSPSGTIVTLTTDNGLNLANVFNGTIWDDRSNPGGQVPYTWNEGLVTDHPYSGSQAVPNLVPEEPLTAVLFEDPNGPWTLTISDDDIAPAGVLNGWAIAITAISQPFLAYDAFAWSDAVQAIPDGGTLTTELPVSTGVGAVLEVTARTMLQHPFSGDLDVTLSNWDGSHVATLTTDNGGATANVFNGTTWRNWANLGGQVPYTSNPGLASDHPYVSNVPVEFLAPEEASAWFGDLNSGYRWRLTVSDDTLGDAGVLAGWGVQVTVLKGCYPKSEFDPATAGFAPRLMNDLVLRHVPTNQHVVWYMDGIRQLSSAPLSPQPAPTQRVVGVDHFRRSASSDLVLRDQVTGAAELWAMNGVVRQQVFPIATLPLTWELAATGDFTNDGSPDIVWRNSVSQEIVIWTMSGAAQVGTLTPVPNRAIDANWAIVAALDYDQDGARDFLWYNSTSGKIVIWFMDEAVVRRAGSFTTPPAAGANNWKVVASANMSSADDPYRGAPDIVWRNETSGKLVVWQMDGSGTTPTRVSGGFTDPASPTPALEWTVVGPK